MKLQKSQTTVAEILRAAGRLFAQYGYYHTSMADILQAVSLSKGAFYYHFRSKEELGLAILEQMAQDYRRELFDPVLSITLPGSRLREMFFRVVHLNQGPEWYNCLLLARLAQDMGQEEGRLKLKLAENVDTLVRFWEELIHDARRADKLKPNLEPRPLAELIVAGLFGALLFRELPPPAVRLEDVADSLQRLILLETL